MKYRTELEKLINILIILRDDKRNITKLMYMLETNHIGIKRIINTCFKYELIFRDSKYFHINAKGLRLLELLELLENKGDL